jgi:hypothetical protein
LAKRKTSLAGFLRKLWSSPKLMDRFSESREGRQDVIKQFNLSARHARLLLDGCVNDLVFELAGGKKVAQSTTTVINCDRDHGDVKCGHPECEAFMNSLAGRAKRKKKR